MWPDKELSSWPRFSCRQGLLLCLPHTPEIGQVDILINNAGVQNGDDIDVNLKGTISVTEHYGIHPNIYSVIMIGSASGHTGSEFPDKSFCL